MWSSKHIATLQLQLVSQIARPAHLWQQDRGWQCLECSYTLECRPTCFFMKSEMTDLPCPSWLMEKLPSLLRRMHAGMDGNTRMASRLSRTGLTASTICGQAGNETRL